MVKRNYLGLLLRDSGSPASRAARNDGVGVSERSETGALKLNPRELAMADEARSRLGRGLASLIGDVGGEAAHVDRPRAQRKVPIEYLKPNPRNPPRAFSESELAELAGSIKQYGVIQPLVVRPVKGTTD